jgi:hypothetical protein
MVVVDFDGFAQGTLLNKLFGTSFMMMDASRRRQCTKGIYLSHGNTKDILVFDVEGTHAPHSIDCIDCSAAADANAIGLLVARRY